MAQTLLFPDPKPLDQRLGRKFFRHAPHRPGVYLMKDAQDRVLYVGKAKDLKQRLNNYRLANPDRMPRRHLRMVREVSRIELQFCPNEAAALRRESRLLRSFKPRFNRAGVWPGKTRFLAWRAAEAALELRIVEVPAPGWQRFGPLNGQAPAIQQALCRLLWLALHPESSITGLPAGWGQGRLPEAATLHCGAALPEVQAGLKQFFWEDAAVFLEWLGACFCRRIHRFERALIAADLEALRNFSSLRVKTNVSSRQLALL
jgi:predicted GIY-YIG superfamily endonuclease